ncbi:hypothetical protein M438DRAFT_336424 [Aureobasidium pullulans EXF-150]|uniref:Uncharacterized protein n=1 Tax=Aureobasidium pullulans EXF-150 TaxID=1043002 RepID=A0A074Y8A3_AURPU|nr:uncharacterized protein M438DRAFT_336424 [Aureobasidium pullulans EXF-150]KEQ83081.1 hypothetical protein M438DRAFT_336424 [Aureobasidium pullulans EXF-150]
MNFKNNSELIDFDPNTRDDNDHIDKIRTEIAESDVQITQPTSQHQPTAALEVAKEQLTASNTASVDGPSRIETTWQMRATAHIERRKAANRRKIEEALGRKVLPRLETATSTDETEEHTRKRQKVDVDGDKAPCAGWNSAETEELRKELQHKLETLKSQKETIEQEFSAAISQKEREMSSVTECLKIIDFPLGQLLHSLLHAHHRER